MKLFPEFVAEFTINHMGSLNLCLRMIEKAKEIGCDYIKMQKKDVSTFYTKKKLSANFISPYGDKWGEYRSMFEFNEEDYQRVDKKCKEIGIPWFSTIQDLSSLEFMLKFDLPMYKVASINARNKKFLRVLVDRVPRGKKIVISVGGSTLQEIEDIIKIFPKHRLCILHCVSEYPCKPESTRLGNILELKKRFASNRISIGYSGHEIGYIPSIIAADMGADLIEKHFCISRYSFVHHIDCALEPSEYNVLIRIVKNESSLKKYYAYYPRIALRSEFGMSKLEEDFLIRHTYRGKYLKEKTEF